MADRIGIDFSAGLPSAPAIKARGVEAVIGYLSERRPSAQWMLAKPLTKAYTDELRAAGIEVVSNYQFGKEGDPTANSDWRFGYEGGKKHGTIALSNHWKAGGAPWRPCYAPVDANPTDDEIDRLVIPFLKGWAEVWGVEWTGVYCNVPTWERIKAKSNLNLRWFWQHDWDGNRTDHRHHPDATMHQTRIDADTVDGVGVDWNVLLKADYGQWSKSVNPNPIETFPIRNALGLGVGFNKGSGRRLRIYIHTSEGVDWKSTAQGTAQYQASTQTGSYHYLIDDNEIIQTVRLTDTAWAVLSDNDVSVNICLVMSSGACGSGACAVETRPKSRAQWLEHDKMLRMLRYLIAYVREELAKAGTVIPAERVDINGVGANRRGVSSHNNYTYGSLQLKGYKDGTHWDVPDTFPYDHVLGGSVVPPDPDAFPLPTGYYYGPLDGPDESISGRYNEPQEWIDGLKRWQRLVGIPASGVWDAETQRVARQLQMFMKWQKSPGNGYVYRGEWDAVVRQGWRPETPPEPTPLPPPATKRAIPLPVGRYRIGSPYGQRGGEFHRGQDFEADDGTPILAAADGVVELAQSAQGFGQWIVVKLADGGRNVYGHMWDARTHVRPGQTVRVGETIALVGSNGQSTGPHLHFEVLRPSNDIDAAARIDPMPWLHEGEPMTLSSKLGDLTGDGLTDKFGMRATDLGAMVEAPNGDIVAVFGDTFRDRVGGADWRSPVVLIGRRDAAGLIQWQKAGGSDPNYARQLWYYKHDNSKLPGTISTVIPSDLLRVGDSLYLHVMVNRGFGNVVWTEIWRSVDNGVTWLHMGEASKLDGTAGRGLLQCVTWEYDPADDWVYVFSTGFQRDKGLVLRRCRPNQIGDQKAWQSWFWNGSQWGWGTSANNPSIVTPAGEKWGELTLRKLDRGWVLGGLLGSEYGLVYRVLNSPLDNLHTSEKHKLIEGTDWANGNHAVGKVAQCYGGYVVPGSRLGVDGGLELSVSQWNTAAGWPYKVMQFRSTLPAVWDEPDPTPPGPDPAPTLAAIDQLDGAMTAYGDLSAVDSPVRPQIDTTRNELNRLKGMLNNDQ